MSSKANLNLTDKVNALEEVSLIISDAILFIKQGKIHYDRVLASALHTLLIQDRSNTPLLLSTASEINYEMQLIDDTPQGPKTYSIDDFLSLQKWGSAVHQESLSNAEFIKHFRDKRSISHQDPNMTSEMLHSSSADGWNIGGLPSETFSLLNIAEFILPELQKTVQHARSEK